jgi:hypothetical protein
LIEQNLGGFSPEALKNATKHYDKAKQQDFLARLKTT